MIGELLGELIGMIFRYIGGVIVWVFVEIIFGVFVMGLGEALLKPFYKEKKPEGLLVAVTGIATWVVTFIVIFEAVEFLRATLGSPESTTQ